MSNLDPGLYEALLTRLLAQKLPVDEQLRWLQPLDRGDAPTVLARYVSSVLEMILGSPGLESDVSAQAELCNTVLDVLASRLGAAQRGEDLIELPARQLLEVLRPAKTVLGAPQRLPRPTVSLSQDALLASRGDPVLAVELRNELASADRVDLLCAFVRWSGIRVLMEQLGRARARGVPVRVLTTTYTGSTEARALDELQRLGVEVKVSYDTGSTRLHAKAWLFERNSGYSTAYVGSSNLSHTALHDGLEWNVRLTEAASARLLRRFRAAFETYWVDPTFEPYDREVFAKAVARVSLVEGPTLVPFDIQPYPFQREMLYQLEVERLTHGRWKNLIVAATGTGKTVVSAFDYKAIRKGWGEASLLFVAHRQEILQQSLAVFRNVLRDANFGELMYAGLRPTQGQHVFASIQSLHAMDRGDLARLPPDAFDVVIVDEFHHAEAPTYRRLLDHLAPKLLVGMTATPERGDGLDVKHWFDGHVAVDLRLWDALEQGLLCPFQYFGISDGVNLSQVEWRRGGYAIDRLEKIYTADDFRVSKVIQAINEVVDDPLAMRALGFCVSVRHAEYMSRKFNEAHVPSTSVSGESSRAERAAALAALREGSINALFCVDIFNEGLDVPEIDTVLFLRPTESPVVFMQQLGRGLRRVDGKVGLTALDFIGQQHRRFRFDARFQALIGSTRQELQRQVQQGFPFLPAGCSITLDRQSEQAILDNLRGTVRQTRSEIVERLRELGAVQLSNFLDATGFSLNDIYSRSNPGWTTLRREAGLLDGGVPPDEAQLSRALSRMLHIDDPERVTAYTAWLTMPEPPPASALGDRERRLLNMLHFDLWPRGGGPVQLEDSLKRLWGNRELRDELIGLLGLLRQQASHLFPEYEVAGDVALQLHSRYSREEILAALGESLAERPAPWREGVRRVLGYELDVFLITLSKSDRLFSPTTRYKDYPISPTLFHWESQSTTSAASPTGQRYINHRSRGSRILIFVRENSVGDAVGASPFLFLGPASYVSHQSERPMQIVWELEHAMPQDFFNAARVAA